MSASTIQTASPDRCILRHRLFSGFGDPLFRRAETDDTPVMVVMLGDREAVLPLAALQHEFGIDDKSDDGRMLKLITAALDFITSLRPGDPLPPEVLSGEASWEPDPQHLRLAHARLRLNLISWVRPGSDDRLPAAPRDLLAAADDPALLPHLRTAETRAAAALGLAGAAALAPLLDGLAQEFSYVEALRERLLQPVHGVSQKLARLVQGWRGDAVQLEKLIQVRRLNATALRRIGGRFDELDAHTGEVIAALRNIDRQRVFIRANRDWLYRTLRAWQPVLAEWTSVGPVYDERARAVVERTYRFLAPRFMPVTEWLSAAAASGRKQTPERGMVW